MKRLKKKEAFHLDSNMYHLLIGEILRGKGERKKTKPVIQEKALCGHKDGMRIHGFILLQRGRLLPVVLWNCSCFTPHK